MFLSFCVRLRYLICRYFAATDGNNYRRREVRRTRIANVTAPGVSYDGRTQLFPFQTIAAAFK